MDTAKAFDRKKVDSVLKKLGAVRATLADDERMILDAIVTQAAAEAEVEGHAASRGEKADAGKAQPAIAKDAASQGAASDDEVMGHAANWKMQKDTGAAQNAAAKDAADRGLELEDEVSGHAMSTQAKSVGKADPAADRGIRIVFNSETGEYKLP
jgi:hypothetical protein